MEFWAFPRPFFRGGEKGAKKQKTQLRYAFLPIFFWKKIGGCRQPLWGKGRQGYRGQRVGDGGRKVGDVQKSTRLLSLGFGATAKHGAKPNARNKRRTTNACFGRLRRRCRASQQKERKSILATRVLSVCVKIRLRRQPADLDTVTYVDVLTLTPL